MVTRRPALPVAWAVILVAVVVSDRCCCSKQAQKKRKGKGDTFSAVALAAIEREIAEWSAANGNQRLQVADLHVPPLV